MKSLLIPYIYYIYTLFILFVDSINIVYIKYKYRISIKETRYLIEGLTQGEGVEWEGGGAVWVVQAGAGR